MQSRMLEARAWEKYYKTGIEALDKQHVKLFTIARKIIQIHDDEMRAPSANSYIGAEGIKFLKSYVIEHFTAEEAYMRKLGYSGYAEHKAEHDKFRDMVVVRLEQMLEESNYSEEAIRKLIGVVLAWLVNHIAREDMAIVGSGVPKPKKHAESESVGETIKDVMSNMFSSAFHGEKPILINTDYKGEDFGKAVYYEQSYDSLETKQKITILSVVEQRMIFYLGSSLLDSRVSEMSGLLYAMIEEFGDHVLKNLDPVLIPAEHARNYVQNKFLTAEEFGERLKERKPEFSMLFETRVGHFAVLINRRSF